MSTGDDALTSTRLDVAEMKGMLTQALSDHGQRLNNLEADNVAIHGRLTDKGKQLARLDERTKDLEENNAAKSARTFSVLATIAGLGGLTLAILNRITL